MIKFYQGKKYAHLNVNRIDSDYNVGYRLICVKGNNMLFFQELKHGQKRITNSTANNDGTIIMYDINDSQGNDTPIHLRYRRWCCDSWAIPNKDMSKYLDDNHVELLALLGR